MERQIKIIDKTSTDAAGSPTVKVFKVKVRNYEHFAIQKANRAAVFRDKTKYCRKRKHKSDSEDY